MEEQMTGWNMPAGVSERDFDLAHGVIELCPECGRDHHPWCDPDREMDLAASAASDARIAHAGAELLRMVLPWI